MRVSWSKLDDGFHEHPKTVAMSDKAFRLYVCGITYSSRHRLVGKLTKAHVAVLYRLTGATEQESQELADLIAWESDGSGYIIHGYEEYNPDQEEISRKRAEAGRIGGIHSGLSRSKRSKTEANASEANEAKPKQNEANGPVPIPVPDPNKTLTPPISPPGGTAPSARDQQPSAGVEADYSATAGGQDTPKIKRFMPPQLAEVSTFFTELGRCDQAEPFHDYYTANGWRIGRTPMKDWKAAARGWLRNDFRKPFNGRANGLSLEEIKAEEMARIKRLGI